MEQEFKISKEYPHVKVYVDKPNELYIFKCYHCRQKLEYGLSYKKLEEASVQFLFDHKKCLKQEDEKQDANKIMQMNRHGHYVTSEKSEKQESTKMNNHGHYISNNKKTNKIDHHGHYISDHL